MEDGTRHVVPSGRAIVIGGSVAGLLAARVLADHFAEVLVVERDRFPEGDGPRKGVPQGQHIHVLLSSGRIVLEQLFPGLQDELAAAGAPTLDFVADMALLGPVGWAPRVRSEHVGHTCTRPLLEARLRRRVMALPRVRFLEGVEAVGLLAESAGSVRGIRVRRRGPEAETQPLGELPADLVVDTSGRASHAPRWLAELGIGAPQETVINAFLGYASRLMLPPPGFSESWKAMYVQCAPPQHLRGGVIWPVEGGRWMVGVVGMGRDYPPTDDAGFMDFARSLRTPEFARALEGAQALSPVVGYRGTENRLRHFERLKTWPTGFVVLGDAACAFNPVYGQGMSAAAQGAMVLDAWLRARRLPNARLDGRLFQRRLAQANRSAWSLSTGADLRGPATEGARPGRADQLLYRYLDLVFERGIRDAGVALVLADVLHLRRPPSALLRPRVVGSVVRGVFG
jgi:2-polyprenyl-6-methoxyphenol hydroxylase-like FAD-dependent oxidoreductase